MTWNVKHESFFHFNNEQRIKTLVSIEFHSNREMIRGVTNSSTDFTTSFLTLDVRFSRSLEKWKLLWREDLILSWLIKQERVSKAWVLIKSTLFSWTRDVLLKRTRLRRESPANEGQLQRMLYSDIFIKWTRSTRSQWVLLSSSKSSGFNREKGFKAVRQGA